MALSMTATGLTALTKDEGAIDGLYDDPSGYCTFGVGHLVHPTDKWGCFLLAWHLSRSYAGSLFAGAAFTFSHFHFAHAVGHMQLVSLQWIPFFVLAFLRLLESGGVTRGLVAAVCLFLVALCDFYYTFYCVLIGAAVFVREAVVRRAPLFWARAPHAGGLTVRQRRDRPRDRRRDAERAAAV